MSQLVKSVVLAIFTPVYPDKQTSSEPGGMSQTCHELTLTYGPKTMLFLILPHGRTHY
jgi:hypothetical protein